MTARSAHPSNAETGRATLADRYVHAATRKLPEEQRADIADELKGSIADRVQSMREERPGGSAMDAERAALTELGDPDRLSAGYSGQALVLIGPEIYPVYARVLKALLVTAVPIATIVVTAIDAIEGASIGAVIGGAVWMAFIVATQIAFWVTLTFALVERRRSVDPTPGSLATEWTPDQLPELPRDPRGSVGELITTVVWLTILGAAVVSQHPDLPLYDERGRQPVLDPGLWSFWLPLILVLIVLEMGFEIVKHRVSGWTPRLATISTVTGALFAAPIIYLAASDMLLNPAAVAKIQDNWSGFDPGTASTVVIASALGIWAWDTAGSWRKTRTTWSG